MATYPGPFLLAGVVAVIPLLVLAAAAPGGHDWVWLEYPRHITFVAFALGIGLCFARARHAALLVLAGTLAFPMVWELVDRGSHWRADESIARAAPWLVGAMYSALAFLCIARSDDTRKNLVRAGSWLVGVALVALAITLNNRSWLTLENLGQAGTFRSSVAWPDTKKLSLALDLVALAAGVFAIVYGPRAPERIPRATLRR